MRANGEGEAPCPKQGPPLLVNPFPPRARKEVQIGRNNGIDLVPVDVSEPHVDARGSPAATHVLGHILQEGI